MDGNPTQVRLGDRTYELEEQRIGRIRKKLSAVLGMFGGAASGEVPEGIGETLHDALKVFIPKLAPLWSLAGYPSEAAYAQVIEHEAAVAEARQAIIDEYARDRAERGVDPPHPSTWGDLPPEIQATYTEPDFTDPYDEDADQSPRPSEIIDAIEKIFAIHGGDRMVRLLKNFIGPETIRAQLRRWQAEATLRRSSSLPRANGASAPTTSTTTDPTSPDAEEESVSHLGDF